MTLPPWPAEALASGQVLLRAVDARNVAMARQLSTDPYVPQKGSLPGDATMQEASDWVERQQGRHAERAGFSFTIARRTDDFAIGHCRQLVGGVRRDMILYSSVRRGHSTR